jgi:hypothetical protein
MATKVHALADPRGARLRTTFAIEAGHDQPRRSLGWWPWIVGLGLLLGLLGIAEVTWLHDLPQDRVSRTTLVAFPRSAGSGARAPIDWPEQIAKSAVDAPLFTAIVARLGATPATAALATRDLAEQTHVSNQCIRWTDAAGQPRQGVLLVAIVRGPTSDQVEAIGATWARELTSAMALAYPELVVESVESLGTQYELCP